MTNRREEILARLKVILREILKLAEVEDSLGEEVELLGQGIGLDSVEILHLVGAIEEEFGLVLDDESLRPELFLTLGSVVTLIEDGQPR